MRDVSWRRFLYNPVPWAVLIYALGVALRIDYTLHVSPPESLVTSDMGLYVDLARRIASGQAPLHPWDVTHPLGYPSLVAYFIKDGGPLSGVVHFQLVVSCLVPLSLGLLGLFAFGRRTALAALAFASLYFPFIEFGALFLSEIHFIFALSVAFTGFLAARAARRRGVALLLAVVGGFALSVAASLKSVALPAAAVFFAVEGLALFIKGPRDAASLRARLAPWVARTALVVVAAAPLLGVVARSCTRANRGNFCVTGNKVGSDFLLGHYGRIADIHWGDDEGHGFGFGSPGSYLRHYDQHPSVPFPMTDNKANADEAWRWIFAHPFEAAVVSFDHLYDTFFGVAMWPTYGTAGWTLAHLSQLAFVVLLFVPMLFAVARIAKRGWLAFLTSRTFLILAPVGALAFTVFVATGEVRYRVPFDSFFIVVACALAVGELESPDGVSAAVLLPESVEAVPPARADLIMR
jgi:hypothetical protein